MIASKYAYGKACAWLKLALATVVLLIGTSVIFAVDIDNKAINETYEELPFERKVILNRLTRKIDKLQMSYIAQLNKAERYEAQKLLDEIRSLAQKLAATPPPPTASTNVTVNIAPTPAPRPNPRPAPAPKPVPISDKDFIDLKNSIRRNSFGDAGLDVLKSAADGNNFRSAQVVELLGLFPFSTDKLKALQIAYPKCIDTQNKYKIIDAFMFDSDKKEAREIMERARD